MTDPDLTIVANRGELGGGEVMLLELATAARRLGFDVAVAAPSRPAPLLDAARGHGFRTYAIPGVDRGSYARHLRAWDQAGQSGRAGRSGRTGLLWCNGLLPALATSGRGGRVVHLHQRPTGLQRLAARAATWRADTVVVPSLSMREAVRGALVLPNWTAELPALPARPATGTGPAVVGYLGRLQVDKGVDVLAGAVERLLDAGRDVRLVVAGDSDFGTRRDAARIEPALARLGDRARRVGRVPREQFFEAVDLAVFPSVWPEPFGLVVAEAMGFARPFVITGAGALPEVAGPEHRWVARRGEVDDLARVIGCALDQDQQQRRADLDAARARWVVRYSPAAGRDRLGPLLERLLTTSLDRGADGADGAYAESEGRR